jgi:hypothetical protein
VDEAYFGVPSWLGQSPHQPLDESHPAKSSASAFSSQTIPSDIDFIAPSPKSTATTTNASGCAPATLASAYVVAIWKLAY